MNRTELNGFRRTLEELADRIRGDVAATTEAARRTAGGQAAGELTNAPQHLGDMGSEEFLHGMNVTLLANEEHLADEVHAAIQRLNDGRFGSCEACGEPIAQGRLEALPYARYCVNCAATVDSDDAPNFNAGRVQGPADTLAGRSNGAPRDDDGVVAIQFDDTEGQEEEHAIGTAGGGTALGGLAGTTEGHGDPDEIRLERATANGDFDNQDSRPPANEDRDREHF